MTDLRNLPVDQLVEPWILLRPVEQHTVAFMEMKDSIAATGLINSIAVRPCKRHPGLFEVIDGMYRLTCVKALGLKTIPVIVMKDATDEEVLRLQLQANAIRPETKPCDFARQLRRIQKANPGITLATLSVMVSKSPSWIGHQLGLLNLSDVQQTMVDRGEICVQNAYMLAKVPPKFRNEYIDRAKTMQVAAFGALVAGIVKQYREAVRQGKLDAFFTEDFEPQAYLRSLAEIQEESRTHLNGPLIVTSELCETPMEIWNAALRWSMHLDPQSVREQEKAARAKVREKWKFNT